MKVYRLFTCRRRARPARPRCRPGAAGSRQRCPLPRVDITFGPQSKRNDWSRSSACAPSKVRRTRGDDGFQLLVGLSRRVSGAMGMHSGKLCGTFSPRVAPRSSDDRKSFATNDAWVRDSPAPIPRLRSDLDNTRAAPIDGRSPFSRSDRFGLPPSTRCRRRGMKPARHVRDWHKECGATRTTVDQ